MSNTNGYITTGTSHADSGDYTWDDDGVDDLIDALQTATNRARVLEAEAEVRSSMAVVVLTLAASLATLAGGIAGWWLHAWVG